MAAKAFAEHHIIWWQSVCLHLKNRQNYHAQMRIGVFFKTVGFAPWEMLDIVDGLAHDTWHEMKLASIN